MAGTENGPGLGLEPAAGLAKSPTGIKGFDEITGGGLPTGRVSLVCGGTGSGKTIFGISFLVAGAVDYGESGVFVAFEETEKELSRNVASLGFNLDRLRDEEKLLVDYISIERSEVEANGEFDLEGLFIRLACSIDSVGAKRVVLDTIETLFGGLPNESLVRSEVRRLFRWLKDRGVTTVVTGEGGKDSISRYGLEEYISDCVIFLDNRVAHQVATRRLRVLKYRGSVHETSEFPFIIGELGLSLLPITSLGLAHSASKDRISSGIEGLDEMLGGKGYYKGSTVLVTGTAGAGKTSIAQHFVDSACARGERCLVLAFEESPDQLKRNMMSVGIDLDRWTEKGLLKIHASRPSLLGLETQLVNMHSHVDSFEPEIVVVDPVTTFTVAGTIIEAAAMLARLIDFLKDANITAMLTSLTSAYEPIEASQVGISSLVDTWIMLRNKEQEGERNRFISVMKSRGMANASSIHGFEITSSGVQV